MMGISFRQFVELVEAPPDYLSKMKDELGIDPKNLEGMPQWMANTKLGQFSYNGMMYQFKYVRGNDGEIVGAMLKPMITQRAYFPDKDKMVRSPDSNPDSDKEFFVSREKLDKLLNQEAGAAPQGGAGGMPGGMPGMPGGMGL